MSARTILVLTGVGLLADYLVRGSDSVVVFVVLVLSCKVHVCLFI